MWINLNEDIFLRSKMLIGEDALNKLKNSHVAVFGLGGVGSYTVEALARAGVGCISIFDGDIISKSNINRQLFALHSTLGNKKTEICKNRILDINPEAKVFDHDVFYTDKNQEQFDFSQYNYIVDAIDIVSAKILIICNANLNNIPIISCMGTGNKLDPTKFVIDDIYSSSVCPLARVMRKELRNRNIKSLNVLFSTEKAKQAQQRTPSSISFVPPVAGFILASKVVRDIAALD